MRFTLLLCRSFIYLCAGIIAQLYASLAPRQGQERPQSAARGVYADLDILVVVSYSKMATIYNSDLTKGIQQDAKIQIGKESVPNQLAEKVVPVMETNPRLLRPIEILVSKNGTSGTLFTVPSDKDFYLCNAFISASNNAAAQTSIASLIGTSVSYPAAVSILVVNFHTSNNVDVGHAELCKNFARPALLRRGTTISYTSSNVTAASFGISGFYVED